MPLSYIKTPRQPQKSKGARTRFSEDSPSHTVSSHCLARIQHPSKCKSMSSLCIKPSHTLVETSKGPSFPVQLSTSAPTYRPLHTETP
ncbi:hypothetical protein PC9H_008875 [Pleurotus ostreatus]|uniref:Uncharacterized protein n=1 Tax=Pleurotus ostreatus TaxID=5322 RepID=A0A8H6ZU01_PLEOS|nr:uncharacterized protein PC9H_008875 [Pleurotus ostreatus]KAF7426506.1 hypothetical protein PC9H_008875 [Pleurotus ostreatus]